MAKHYILYSPEMSAPQLASAGLQVFDSVASDHLLRVADFRSFGPQFLRGDCNGDGARDISDPVQLLALLFLSGATDCPDACDVDDDGMLTVSDVIHAAQALFGLGAPIAPPYLACGPDPTTDSLSCLLGSCP